MKIRGRILQGFIAAFFVLAAAVCIAQAQAPAQTQTPAQAGPWKVYFESENQRYYYDSTSIERPGKRIVRVWERIVKKGKGDEEFDKVKSLIELDCSSSKYRIIATKEYDVATKTEKPEVRSDGEPWSYYDQESILGVLYDNVCFEKSPSGKVERVRSK